MSAVGAGSTLSVDRKPADQTSMKTGYAASSSRATSEKAFKTGSHETHPYNFSRSMTEKDVGLDDYFVSSVPRGLPFSALMLERALTSPGWAARPKQTLQTAILPSSSWQRYAEASSSPDIRCRLGNRHYMLIKIRV